MVVNGFQFSMVTSGYHAAVLIGFSLVTDGSQWLLLLTMQWFSMVPSGSQGETNGETKY